jgi:hypothetical protein
LQHLRDMEDAVVLLLATDYRHAIFGFQLRVTFGASLHLLTLTDQVMHFRFDFTLFYFYLDALFIVFTTVYLLFNLSIPYIFSRLVQRLGKGRDSLLAATQSYQLGYNFGSDP